MRTLGFLSLTRSFMRSGYSIPFAFRYWLLPWFSSMIMMLWRDLPVSSWTVLSWTWFVSLSYDEECPLPRLFEHRNISRFLATIRSRLTWNFLMAESGSCCCWTASADWSVTRWLTSHPMNQWQQLLVTGGGSIYGLGLERSFVIALLLLLLIGVFFFVVVFLPSRFLPLDMTSPQKETVPALFCFLFFLFFLLFFFWLSLILLLPNHKLKSKARAPLHWPWQPELTSVQSLTECSHVDFIIFTQSGVEAPNVFTLNHKLPSSGTCVHNQSRRPSQLHHEPQVSRVPRVPLQHK